MRLRMIHMLLLLTSLLGYMEWGQGQHAFLFEAEYRLLTGGGGAGALTHPLVLLPMAGQLLLLFTLFQKKPSRRIASIAIILLGMLLFFVLLAGIFGQRWLMVVSILPFALLSLLYFFRRGKYVDA